MAKCVKNLCTSEEERAMYTLFAHAQFPQDFWEFKKCVRCTNPCETCRLYQCEKCLPLTILCVDNDEGAMKAISCLLAGIIHASVHSI